MNVEIISSNLQGTIDAVASKSYTHRALIILSLIKNGGKIVNPSICEDTITTIMYLKAMGLEINILDKLITINKKTNFINPNVFPYNDNSGTSIRLLLPIVTQFFKEVNFLISKNLFKRLIDTDLNDYYNYNFSLENDKIFLSISKKTILPSISLNKTTQYASGFLMLSIVKNLVLTFNSTNFGNYLLMTIDYLNKINVKLNIVQANNCTIITTDNSDIIYDYTFNIEGDYSLMANFIILGCYYENIIINNLSSNSIQGDYQILDIINNLFKTKPFEFSNNQLHFNKANLKTDACINIDISNIPDIAPLLMVYSLLLKKPSKFYNFKKLSYKESNRIISTLGTIENLNGKYEITDKMIKIYPSKLSFEKSFNSYNDHRIVFLISMISLIERKNCIIENCQCYKKSYPDFFNNILNLSGKCILKED